MMFSLLFFISINNFISKTDSNDEIRYNIKLGKSNYTINDQNIYEYNIPLNLTSEQSTTDNSFALCFYVDREIQTEDQKILNIQSDINSSISISIFDEIRQSDNILINILGYNQLLNISQSNSPFIPLNFTTKTFVFQSPSSKDSFLIPSLSLNDIQTKFEVMNNNKLAIDNLEVSNSFAFESINENDSENMVFINNLIDNGKSKGTLSNVAIYHCSELSVDTCIELFSCILYETNITAHTLFSEKPSSSSLRFYNYTKESSEFNVNIIAEFNDNVTSDLYFNSLEVIRGESTNVTVLSSNISLDSFVNNGYEIHCDTLYSNQNLFARCSTTHPTHIVKKRQTMLAFALFSFLYVFLIFLIGCLIQSLYCDRRKKNELEAPQDQTTQELLPHE